MRGEPAGARALMVRIAVTTGRSVVLPTLLVMSASQGSHASLIQVTASATTAPAPPEPTLLAGPTVIEDDADPSQPGIAGVDRGRRVISVPVQRWLVTYRDLGLSSAQRLAAFEIVWTLQRDRRRFRREHGAEVRRLEARVRLARARGGTPVDAKDVQWLQELRAAGPDQHAVQNELWNLLTPAQQELFRQRLDEVKADLSERRLDRRAKRAGSSAPTARSSPPAGRPAGSADADETTETYPLGGTQPEDVAQGEVGRAEDEGDQEEFGPPDRRGAVAEQGHEQDG